MKGQPPTAQWPDQPDGLPGVLCVHFVEGQVDRAPTAYTVVVRNGSWPLSFERASDDNAAPS